MSPFDTATTTGLLYQPQMIDDGGCGESGGMKIDRGNRSTRRKPAPAPLCPQKIPHEQTRARTRTAAVGSQRLTAWAMARPNCLPVGPLAGSEQNWLASFSCSSNLEHRASVKRFVSLQFLNLRQSTGLLGRVINPLQGRYLHRTIQAQNKRRETSIPWVGFEPTIPAFVRAKTVHALDRAATVLGSSTIPTKNIV
jgi:hypothetical protein